MKVQFLLNIRDGISHEISHIVFIDDDIILSKILNLTSKNVRLFEQVSRGAKFVSRDVFSDSNPPEKNLIIKMLIKRFDLSDIDWVYTENIDTLIKSIISRRIHDILNVVTRSSKFTDEIRRIAYNVTSPPNKLDIVYEFIRSTKVKFPFKREFKSIDDVKAGFEKIKSISNRLTSDDYTSKVRELSSQKLKLHLQFNGRYLSMSNNHSDYEEMDWIVDYFIEESRMKSARKRNSSSNSSSLSPQSAFDLYGDYVKNAVKYFIDRLSPELSADEIVYLLAKRGGNNIFPGRVSIRLSEILFHFREGLYFDKSIQECAHEKASFFVVMWNYLAKILKIKVEYLRIFDGCAGWGDKLISAIAMGIEIYTGIDPNEHSQIPFKSIVDTFSPGKFCKYSIHPLSMPDCIFPWGVDISSYDICMLSPPSFDSEVYSSHQGQSIERFPTFREWFKGFMFPTIDRSLSLLKPGGFLIIQSILINDISPYIESNFPELVYQGAISVKCSTRYKPMWIWRKLLVDTSKVPDIILKTSLERKISAGNIMRNIHPDVSIISQRKLERMYASKKFYKTVDIPNFSDDIIRPIIKKSRFEKYSVKYSIGKISEFEKIISLRSKVWGFTPKKGWEEPADETGLHILVYSLGKSRSRLVASTRLNVYEKFTDVPGYWWFDSFKEYPPSTLSVIGRLVVDESHRNLGIARYLDETCVNISKKLNLNGVFCDVPPNRVLSLESQGFRKIMDGKKSRDFLPGIEWVSMCLYFEERKSAFLEKKYNTLTDVINSIPVSPHLSHLDHIIVREKFYYSDLFLTNNTLEYRRRDPGVVVKYISTLHKRREYLGLVYFLFNYCGGGDYNNKSTIVLIRSDGLSDGYLKYMNLVVQSFSFFKFVIIGEYTPDINHDKRIVYRNEVFDVNIAREYTLSGESLVFVDHARIEKYPSDENVLKRIETQKSIIDIIHPIASMCVHNILLNADGYKFYTGKLFYGPFNMNGINGNVYILSKNHLDLMTYSQKNISERLYYHYINTRCTVFTGEEYSQSPNVDGCYDCTAERHILQSCGIGLYFTSDFEKNY